MLSACSSVTYRFMLNYFLNKLNWVGYNIPMLRLLFSQALFIIFTPYVNRKLI